MFEGGGRTHFDQFLETVLPRVNPAFVLVTGDITDAKSESGLTSGQLEEEWKWYQDRIKLKGIPGKDNYWFDLRGNHDAFNVPSRQFEHFPKYSVQRASSYAHHFKDHSISILSIDASPSYGLPRPYNFFASLNRSRMDRLEEDIEESLRLGIRHRILLGHYPTVTLQTQRTTSGRSFADLTSNVSAYLTGHLHKLLLGLGETIKKVQPNGLWDFEVADLKDHAAYRIGLVDRGRLSFHDFDLSKGSLMICIASPSDSRYALSDNDRSIRVFIFSENPVKDAHATINNKQIPLVKATEPNLWTASTYEQEEGIVVVTATDTGGNRAQVTQPFSSKAIQPFGSFGEFLLSLNFRRLVIWSCALPISFILLSITVLLFFTYRRADHQWLGKLREKIQQEQFLLHRRCWHLKCLYHLHCFAENRPLCYSILCTLIYITIGPWIIGPLAADNALGAIFLFGIWHRGSWTIILDTWFYCLLHLLFFILPAGLLLIIYSTDHNLTMEPKSPRLGDEMEEPDNIQLPLYHWRSVYALVAIWYAFNLVRVCRILINYGLIASITSPVYAWLTGWTGFQLFRMIYRSRRQQCLVPRKLQ